MNQQSEYHSPARKTMLLVMAVSLAGCFFFGDIYRTSRAGWAFSAAVICGMFVYHMFIRFFAPVALWIFFRKKYNYRHRWFQPRSWEPRLYRLLKVKTWKSKAITYDPREFSFQLHSPEEIVNNMCHAEAVHELTAVFSLLSVFFAVPFGSAAMFLLTAAAAAALDSICVVIQRYNRPRVVKIAERKRAAP